MGDVVGLVAQLVLDVVQLTPTRPVPLPASVGVQGRSSFFGKAIPRVAQAKQFKTYTEQVELLRGRGMRIDDQDRAEHLLARLNYYRLSGYWYPMRRFTDDKGAVGDEFVAGASLDLVVDLYKFDERLRHSVFIELDRVETAVRAMLGYELGRIDPLIYLDPKRLGVQAKSRGRDDCGVHEAWLRKYWATFRCRLFLRAIQTTISFHCFGRVHPRIGRVSICGHASPGRAWQAYLWSSVPSVAPSVNHA
ncbi:MAG: Abi family protein [Cutibacterium avidum]|uniref:Abi family protein n=1 Tax=Cutibacterium avidum TaxID=33010 RepID=UPI00211C5609|nr:Abi family protein [Cutibacterium avidum]MDU4635412.1 Abi family protein [Cutibacterium avidum]MDU5985143.1 Abi family protein [Cutibacterium avidum]MDU7484808.1 Abi family protein [Cutibacterium avidum]